VTAIRAMLIELNGYPIVTQGSGRVTQKTPDASAISQVTNTAYGSIKKQTLQKTKQLDSTAHQSWVASASSKPKRISKSSVSFKKSDEPC
tara:strand:+ start:134 stop:403 length:270 start_codon:yes stop_codon:yes gene_type:complete